MREFPLVKLSEVVRLNPRNPAVVPAETSRVTFVPMAAVEAETGRFNASETRTWSAVKKGYTRFQENDVLVAKITPCMENGKACVARHLEGLVGAGSTEFHVLRPFTAKVEPEWVLRFLNQRRIRHEAKRHMSGAVGQQRVPASFYQDLQLPLPELETQQELLDRLKDHDIKIDAAERALFAIQAKLKQARASILKAAVEGRLVETEAALARQSGRYYEDAEELLERVTLEAATRPAEGSKRKSAPSSIKPSAEPELPEPPEGWTWVRIDVVGAVQLGRQRTPKDHNGPHMCPYMRVANVFEDRINLSDVKEMNFTPEEQETFRLEYGDILLNEGQSPHLVGRPAMWRDEIKNACFQNTLVRFRATDAALPRYALIVFRAQLHARRYMNIAKITTNIAHLGAQRFAAVEFPLAPLAEQHQIVAEVERRFSILDQVESTVQASLARCALLRQAILKRAFEGRLVPAPPESSVPADHAKTSP